MAAAASANPAPMELAEYDVVFSVPIWFSPEKNLTINDLLPFFEISLGCEVGEVIFPCSLPYRSHSCPPLSEFGTLWAPWDMPLLEDHQVHFMVTDRGLWEQFRTTIGEQAINLMEDFVLYDDRLQTHLHVHFVAGTSLLYHIGMLYDKVKHLEEHQEQRLQALESAQRRDHARLGICAETLATQHPDLAGPLGLLLTQADLEGEHGPSGPQVPGPDSVGPR
eukprot:s575_g19.t1